MVDLRYMQRALELAERAASVGEVPVGAVLVKQEAVIAEAHNAPISAHDPCAHAELLTLQRAGQKLQSYRLPDTTLYVTLEPCVMCIGAMIHARITHLVFGAYDPKTGACGSAMTLHEHPSHNHKIQVTGGVMAAECGELLRRFFHQRRASKR